jgi:hypothetical protein
MTVPLLGLSNLDGFFDFVDQWGGAFRMVAGSTEELPYSLRVIRDSLIKGDYDQRVLWACLAGLVVLVVFLGVIHRRRNRILKSKEKLDDPEDLFESLLERIELSEGDKELLREMARGGRLRHPAVSLLSPGMLSWARGLWLAEKGGRAVGPEKNARIDAISVKLYEHAPAVMSQ